MNAAVTDAHGTRIEVVDDPECGPGDVVCRVLACAAGDDDLGVALPAVLGREPAGEVVAVGRGVDAVADGDLVAIHAPSLVPGGFAEYLRVPAGGELLPLEGVDPISGTLLEPLAAVLRAQDRAELSGRDSLLLVGAAARGLLHVAAARSRGMEDIYVREPGEARRAVANAWGAQTFAGEPVNVAIVTTTSPRDLAQAAEALLPGGRLLLHADPPPRMLLDIEAHTLAERELRLTASHGAGPSHARAALTLLRAGAVLVGELITARFSLALTGDALTAHQSGAALKAVVLPWA